MKKILLVEDDPFLLDIYNTKIKESGFKVDFVKDGGLVLEKLREFSPDLLVLDIVLPNFDGWEILRKIKDNPDFKDLKIIILSNLGQKRDIEKGLSLGAAKYLIKARYTPGEVVKEITTIL